MSFWRTTGGKCFVCHKFFQRLTHIPAPGEKEDDENGQEGLPTDEDDDDVNDTAERAEKAAQ